MIKNSYFQPVWLHLQTSLISEISKFVFIISAEHT
jgi:hypothetical protein